MPKITWRRVKPLQQMDAIERFEERYGLSLPEDLKASIKLSNGGRPTPNVFRLHDGSLVDVKVMLSYNEEDVENIFKVIDSFIEEYGGDVIPFASDSGGNYYCIMKEQVVMWLHENNEFISVATSFSDFIDGLQELA